MHAFTDADGREWLIKLNLAAVERIEASDLSAILAGGKLCLLDPPEDFFSSVLTDTKLIFAMIWLTIEPQAEATGVTLEQWKESLSGPIIQQAKEAFWNEILDFFPQLRTSLSKLVELYRSKTKEIDRRLSELPIEQSMTEEMDRLIQAASDQLAGKGGVIDGTKSTANRRHSAATGAR